MGVWAHLVRGVHESLRLVPASGPPGDERLDVESMRLKSHVRPRRLRRTWKRRDAAAKAGGIGEHETPGWVPRRGRLIQVLSLARLRRFALPISRARVLHGRTLGQFQRK